MHIIKLNATASTNSYLRELCFKQKVENYTVVLAEKQTKGRGQLGTHWQAEAHKNLTFSVFLDVPNIKVEQQFYISMAVALAIRRTLKELQIPKIKIKWPNDILAEDKKIAGILIENVIKKNRLIGSVIGIGLNVNQKFFDDLPQASSLHLITGVVYNKDEVFAQLLQRIRHYLEKLRNQNFSKIKTEYEKSLFRIKKPSTFKTSDNKTIMGFIKGVTDDGKLKVLLEDEILKTFDLKEIKLLY